MSPRLSFLFFCAALFFGCTPMRGADTPTFRDLFNGKDLTGWVDVNTSKETWSVKDGLLVCSGQPIGVMRSEKQYENFILHIEHGSLLVYRKVIEENRARIAEF